MDIDKINLNISLESSDLSFLLDIQKKFYNEKTYSMNDAEKIQFVEYVNKVKNKVIEEITDMQILTEAFENIINE